MLGYVHDGQSNMLLRVSFPMRREVKHDMKGHVYISQFSADILSLDLVTTVTFSATARGAPDAKKVAARLHERREAAWQGRRDRAAR